MNMIGINEAFQSSIIKKIKSGKLKIIGTLYLGGKIKSLSYEDVKKLDCNVILIKKKL